MSEAAELKRVADQHGIEYQSNAGATKMRELLASHDIHIENVPHGTVEQPASQSTSNLTHELRQLDSYYKLAQTDLDIKKCEDQRMKLRKSLSGDADIKQMLQWERARKYITVKDKYLLNALEAQDARMKCDYVSRISTEGAYFLNVGETYPCEESFDEGRGQSIFTVYTKRTIEPDEQITPDIERDMRMGLDIRDKVSKIKPKDQWHRFQLVDSEFKQYFRLRD